MTLEDIRARSFETLDALGFHPARWLPLPESPFALRPLPEIARRLMAMDALFTWVVFHEASAPAVRVRRYVERNDLAASLTEEERVILGLPREKAHEQHVDTVGWRLENMWPLAWALGFEPGPDLRAAQIEPEVNQAMVYDFLPGLDASVADLLSQARPRSVEAVGQLADLFYCAHNAVRSAQLGRDTVPSGFHPIVHGGAVHERRHALTWMTSPGVAWEDTDLST